MGSSPEPFISFFSQQKRTRAARAQWLKAGLFDQFPCESVYGMHNIPGIEVGAFAIKDGPIMAAFDIFEIEVVGRGGTCSYPTAKPLTQLLSLAKSLMRCRRWCHGKLIRLNPVC